MEGYRDPFNRRPYPWNKEEAELVSFYKKIGEIRRSEQLYKTGFFEIVECCKDILAFTRYSDENGFVLTIINRGTEKYHIDSNIPLKNIETNRIIHNIAPMSSYILKSDFKYSDLNLEFIK